MAAIYIHIYFQSSRRYVRNYFRIMCQGWDRSIFCLASIPKFAAYTCLYSIHAYWDIASSHNGQRTAAENGNSYCQLAQGFDCGPEPRDWQVVAALYGWLDLVGGYIFTCEHDGPNWLVQYSLNHVCSLRNTIQCYLEIFGMMIHLTILFRWTGQRIPGSGHHRRSHTALGYVLFVFESIPLITLW